MKRSQDGAVSGGSEPVRLKTDWGNVGWIRLASYVLQGRRNRIQLTSSGCRLKTGHVDGPCSAVPNMCVSSNMWNAASGDGSRRYVPGMGRDGPVVDM